MNPFIYSNDNKRYHTLNYYYQKKFKTRVSKITLDAHFTCPNIDGKVGHGGCIYCLQSHNEDNLLKQFNKQKTIIDHKWPNSKYIAYFQAHSNTYGTVDELKALYEPFLKMPNVIGLSIATRPDAINDEVLDYLDNLNKRTILTIELGLQTIHETTASLINRCHTLECFTNMVNKLREKHIDVVVHIINGLPNETKEMMLDTVKYLATLDIQGIKIHMLHILKNTPLETLYKNQPFHMLTKEEYVDIVCDQLELLPSKIIIHRLTGDPLKEELIEPKWVVKKVSVLNDIDKELARRNTYQDFNRSILNKAKQILENNLRYNDIAIDATVGDGNDILFLLSIISQGHVYGFDTQQEFINNTEYLLDMNDKHNYTLFNQSHANMVKTLPDLKGKVSAIIFNLGYLPNDNKKITTNYKSTIKAIKDSLVLLNNKGVCLIVVYPDHKEMDITVSKYLSVINDNYSINKYYDTQNKEGPYLISIKKHD